MIVAYNNYQAGFLPHAGGMNDQPALYPILMARIAGTLSKLDDVRNNKPPPASQESTGKVSLLRQ